MVSPQYDFTKFYYELNATTCRMEPKEQNCDMTQHMILKLREVPLEIQLNQNFSVAQIEGVEKFTELFFQHVTDDDSKTELQQIQESVKRLREQRERAFVHDCLQPDRKLDLSDCLLLSKTVNQMRLEREEKFLLIEKCGPIIGDALDQDRPLDEIVKAGVTLDPTLSWLYGFDKVEKYSELYRLLHPYTNVTHTLLVIKTTLEYYYGDEKPKPLFDSCLYILDLIKSDISISETFLQIEREFEVKESSSEKRVEIIMRILSNLTYDSPVDLTNIYRNLIEKCLSTPYFFSSVQHQIKNEDFLKNVLKTLEYTKKKSIAARVEQVACKSVSRLDQQFLLAHLIEIKIPEKMTLVTHYLEPTTENPEMIVGTCDDHYLVENNTVLKIPKNPEKKLRPVTSKKISNTSRLYLQEKYCTKTGFWPLLTTYRHKNKKRAIYPIGKPLSPDHMLSDHALSRHMIDLAKGIATLHSDGITHGSISTRSALVGKKAGWLLIDDEIENKEQVTAPDGDLKSFEADIFSLGALFFQAKTKSTLPWQKTDSDEYRQITSFWNTEPCDDECTKLIYKMLHQSKDQRPKISEVIQTLERTYV